MNTVSTGTGTASDTAGTTGVTVSVFPSRVQGATLPTTVIFAPGETTKSIVINSGDHGALHPVVAPGRAQPANAVRI